MASISTFGFIILGLLIAGRKHVLSGENRFLLLGASAFIFWMLVVFLFSGAPLNQQFWGVFGRNTGVLTYLSLVLILIGTAVIRDRESYASIVNAILLVSLPMTFYCLIQVTGNDPIGWSYKATFGTLGNVNFLSAFYGLVTVAALTFAIAHFRKNRMKSIGFLLLVAIDLLIVYSTSSIQGLMMFAAGTFVVIFFWLRTTKKFRLLQSLFVLVAISLSTPVLMGILNSGPLAKFLFQNSTKLRGDYIHAGWEMTQRFPLFGVGMDAYGDWYREVRGKISTETGIDRIANTAHNIFLDISSNGGFPLLAAYLFILGLAVRSIIRVYRKLGSSFDPVFVSLVSMWFAYQVQALISINQIGVGVWSWIFSGALIGYEYVATTPEETKRSLNRKKARGQLLPAGAGLLTLAGAIFGFTLAWFPLSADAKYFAAVKTQSLEKIVTSTRVLGSTVWHSEMALDASLRAAAAPQAKEIAEYIVAHYPRDNFGWKAILFSDLATEAEKNRALARLKEMDPYYPQWHQ